MRCILFLLCISVALVHARYTDPDYRRQRDQILEQEFKRSTGGRVVLNGEELMVNDILMRWKNKELDEYYHNPAEFNMSKSYFTYRDSIKNSNVYKIIKEMPKGGALHIHGSLVLGGESLVELTYEDHLYACFENNKQDLKFQFAPSTPTKPCAGQWSLLSDLRYASGNVQEFDNELKKYFTMYGKRPYDPLDDINKTWAEFNRVHKVMKSLINYRPLREKHVYAALKKFYEDNVQYMEIRSTLYNVFELDGTVHTGLYLAELYQNVTNKFMQDYPDFGGIKYIFTSTRTLDIPKLRRDLALAREFKIKMPELYAGYDLVGQEETGKSLIECIPELASMKDDVNYFFHGGETDWYGTRADENLVDAILLNTQRIGHGYALLKHPSLVNQVKEKDIAIEVNVISNNVLSLVSDVRNHPLASLLALDVPVVVSSDDPGVWGADPLSHDFYVSFIAVASKRADLRLLKQLAINSIRYSALDDQGKARMFRLFNKRWAEFVRKIIAMNARGYFRE